MKIKKLLSLALVSCLILSIGACTAKTDETLSDTIETTTSVETSSDVQTPDTSETTEEEEVVEPVAEDILWILNTDDGTDLANGIDCMYHNFPKVGEHFSEALLRINTESGKTPVNTSSSGVYQMSVEYQRGNNDGAESPLVGDNSIVSSIDYTGYIIDTFEDNFADPLVTDFERLSFRDDQLYVSGMIRFHFHDEAIAQAMYAEAVNHVDSYGLEGEKIERESGSGAGRMLTVWQYGENSMYDVSAQVYLNDFTETNGYYEVAVIIYNPAYLFE